MPHLVLNALKVHFEPSTIPAFEKPFHSTEEVRDLRQRLGSEWFFYFEGERIYGLPRVEAPKSRFGEPTTLTIAEHPGLAKLLVEEALPAVFHSYKPLFLRPLTIVSGRKDQDRVARAASTLKLSHPLLHHFTVFPKLEVQPRLVDPDDRGLRVAIFLELSSRWEISAPLEVLSAAGVNLGGLHVVRPEPAPDERRLVGKLDRLDGAMALLSESFDGTQQVPAAAVRLEGRRDACMRCLTSLLGPEHGGRLAEEIDLICDLDGTGPAVMERMEPIIGHLKKRPIALPGGLSARVGDLIELRLGPGVGRPPVPVEYCFDAAKTQRDRDNWKGLRRFGPFSRDTIGQGSPKVVILCDERAKLRVEQFARKLRDGVRAAGDVFDAGFRSIYHLTDTRFDVVPLSLQTADRAGLARRYRDEALRVVRPDSKPSAAIVILDDADADLPDHINPYLYARAGLMMMGVPVQAIRMSKVLRPDFDLQYILQSLSIALYAKLGGVPWTVVHDQTLNDELVIGLGTAEIRASRFVERQRVVGVTTVFRGDGNYLVGNLSRECAYSEYPAVLRDTTLEVLRWARARNGWAPGNHIRIVFHSWKPLKNVEIADIVSRATREVGEDLNLEFAVLTIAQEHPMCVQDLQQRGYMKKGDPAPRGVGAPGRGTILRVREDEHLVCTQGPQQMKEMSQPLPSPLLVRLNRGHELRRTDLWYLSEQVLKFTSLSWKSKLPAPLPATVYYSKLIAEQLGRMKAVDGWSPLTLNQMLPESKWFL